jgi:hypothetical protein
MTGDESTNGPFWYPCRESKYPGLLHLSFPGSAGKANAVAKAMEIR